MYRAYKTENRQGKVSWTIQKENGSDSGTQEWRDLEWYETVEVPDIVNTDFVSRNEAMQEAANEFVDLLAEQSPDSRVGVAAYSNQSSLRESLQLTTVNTNGVSKIKSKIASIKPYEWTYSYRGLKYAEEQFNNDKSTNDKIVVLLSDGEDNDKDAAETVANRLKKEVAIYSVGFHVNSTAESFLKGIATSENNYYSADSMEELVSSFKLILEDSFEGVSFENATIVDVIDSRFKVVDQNGNDLSEGAEIEDNNGKKGYLKKNSSGEWYVEWTGVTITPKASDSNTPGWSATIYVKAKDDYIGGNDVATNGDGSGITFSGNYVPFGKPHVNVKAELTVSDKAITIYKGDSAPTETEILQEMFNTGSITKYEGVDEEDFHLQWYEVQGQDVNEVNELPQNPTEDKTFHLKVTYDVERPSDESNTNTTLGDVTYYAGEPQEGTAGNDKYIVTAVNSNDSKLDYGIYNITVISGQLVIKKTLEEEAGSNQTFTFTIKKDDQTFTPSPEARITIQEGSTEGTWTVNGLERGTYVITENSAPGYSLQDVAIVDETNAESNVPVTKDSATIILGDSKTDGNDVIKNYTYNSSDGGTKGTVNFTNTSVMDNWQIVKRNKNDTTELLDGAKFQLSSTDNSNTYYGLSGERGIVEWYSNPECTTSAELLRGEYTLEEIAAPSGYILSEVEWTVKIAKNGRLSWIKENGSEIDPVEAGTTSNKTYVFYYENVMLYELPEAGGSGIYWYTISGALLMMGAALIVYREKRKREVLLRK